MRFFTTAGLYSFVFLQALVTSSPLSPPLTRRDIPVAQVQRELGGIVSKGSTIFGPSDPSWPSSTHRWSTVGPPNIQVVVQPAEEADIPKIVKYCNQNSFPFLAVNRGHGFTTTLGTFKGIQIDLKQLNKIAIQPDRKSALFQGGAYAHDVMKTLWDQGYVTSTGANECVGLAGPALGGGHGRLEGLYGLVSDNIIHLNMVLADGSTITVNETSHSDLLWAMKGAGHNFGIVTSFKLKIFARKSPTWHYHNYYWSEDKLELVFEKLNKLQDHGKQPALLGSSYGQISFNRTLDKDKAILWWTFAYNGPAKDAEKLLKPFNDIPAISQTMGDVPYPEIVIPQDTAASSCGSGAFAISTVMLQTYNITAQRQIYNHFNKKAALYPDLAKTARLYHEGYATAGVQAVNPASTAYPHRSEIHLAFFLTAVPEGSNLTEPAKIWAKETWDLWRAGQPTRKSATYVNYATGNDYESLQSIYGYEPWRLDRLRKLKAKYDPRNRFRYYNPIVSQ